MTVFATLGKDVSQQQGEFLQFHKKQQNPDDALLSGVLKLKFKHKFFIQTCHTNLLQTHHQITSDSGHKCFSTTALQENPPMQYHHLHKQAI